MRNDEYWQDIESQPAFHKETNDYNYEKCWEWLEKFQQCSGKQINSRGLILLTALMQNVYDAGKAAGENDAGPVISNMMNDVFARRTKKDDKAD